MTSTAPSATQNPLPPLAAIARQLAAAHDAAEIAGHAAEGALLLTGAEGVYLEIARPERGEVEVAACAGAHVPEPGLLAPFPGSLTHEMMLDGAPRVLASVLELSDGVAPYLAEECPDCTALVAPLIAHDEVMGALVVLRGLHAPVFDPREIAEARILADLTALALRRARLTAALSEERAFRDAVLNQMPSGISIAEAPSGRLLYHNEEAVHLLRHPLLPAADFQGYTQYGALHPDGTPLAPDEYPIARAILTGAVVHQEEMLYRRGDGSLTHLSVNAAPVRDGEGRVVAAVSTFHDVSEQKRAREELERLFTREQEARRSITTILESISDAFFTLDREWRFTYLNHGARDVVRALLNADPEAAIGRVFWEVVPQFRGTRFEEEYRRAVETGESAHFEEYSPAFDTWFAVNAYPSGEGLSVYFRDVTEVKRVEAAVRQSEQRFRMLVESVRDYAIYMLDPEGRVVSWNEGAEQIVGYSADEIVGEHFSRFYASGDRERGLPEEVLRRAAAEGRLEEEGWRVRKDGTRIWVSVVVTAIRDGQSLVGYATVARDLTERRRAEQRLRELNAREREARAEAEAANRAKSDFLATMSHELRTPINAIMGYTDLLQMGVSGPLNEKQLAQIDRVRASSEHLLGLINEVLDLAKIESGRIVVARERALAADAVGDALALVETQAARREVSLEVACARADETFYCGDESRVRQILVNLLSNAVKFTEDGGRIAVRCGTAAEPDEAAVLVGDGPWTYVQVKDNGVGIPPEKLESIFHPFVQVESVHTRKRGGTGLGLTISRQLARLMGGDLTVHSREGKGSTFTLWLPRSRVHPEPAVGETTLVEDPEEAARAGLALRARADDVLRATVARLRREDSVPDAAKLGDAELEDHLLVLLTDIAQSLAGFRSDTDAQQLIDDGTQIQRTISELHGVQRARLGWTTEGLRTQFRILREESERELAAELGSNPTDSAMRVLRGFLAHAERIAEHSLQTSRNRTLS